MASLTLFQALTLQARPQSSAAEARSNQPLNDTIFTTLHGTRHPLARPEFDQGPAPSDLPMDHMLLVLKRSPEREAALQTFLGQQQDKSSANYHDWVSPEQFGIRFGPADQDLRTIASWLQSHGFREIAVNRGRSVVEFSGTAAQVQEAFHTQIHRYVVNGAEHWANASDIEIPNELTPVMAGLTSLHNFSRRPLHQRAGLFERSGATGLARRVSTPEAPDFTFPGGCNFNSNCYGLGPYDFATIYSVLPLWNSGIDGTGQAIAVVGQSNVNLQDTEAFRSVFGLPANDPIVILNGPDPGILATAGDETESDLDLQWAGAVAPKATIKFVVSASTNSTAGVDLSALYVVDNNLAPVLSESYGGCEADLLAGGNLFYSNIWEQAAAQGITVIVSSGDSGSAGCDSYQGQTPEPAQRGVAVNGIASTPYNVAVGGTDFNDIYAAYTYWSGTNDPVHQSSALRYIPEFPWNDSCASYAFVVTSWGNNPEATCNIFIFSSNVDTIGGGGGLSACAFFGATGQCAHGYGKPSWQSGTGVPNDSARDIPDVSLFASNGFVGNFYFVCESDANPGGLPCSLNSTTANQYFVGIGGTSSSAPAFAGMMALVNQESQSGGQGNANYVLYNLAAQPSQKSLKCDSSAGPAAACIFNDISVGTNTVPCAASTPNCQLTNSRDTFGVLSGYSATAGYDLATGLGSVNANNLVQNWNSAAFHPTATTLSLNQGAPVTITHGQSVPVTVTVTSTAGTPTGDVSLLANSSNGEGVDTRALAGGQASWQTDRFPGGTYVVTAHYPGDGIFGASTSTAPVPVTVLPENSTVIVSALTLDQHGNTIPFSSGPFGNYVSLRADVKGAISGSTDVPTGCIVLADNGTPIPGGPISCPFALNSMGYTFTPNALFSLPPGPHSATASYGGDTSYNSNAVSTPATFTITAAPTLSTLGTIPVVVAPTASFGLAVTIHTQAGLNPLTGTFQNIALPAGTVQFFSGTTPVGSPVAVTGYVNQVTQTAEAQALETFVGSEFPMGQNSIHAVYGGDGNYAGSASAASALFAGYSTTTTVTSSSANPAPGANVTLTAQVVPGQGGGPVVTGAVQFRVNGANFGGPVTLANGQAQLTTNSLPKGADGILAFYSGDNDYFQSNGGTLVTVESPDFTFTTNPQNMPTITVAAPGTNSPPVTLAITSEFGYTGVVNFTPASCSIVPLGSESSCIFNPSSVSGTGTTQVTISTTAASTVFRFPHARPTNLTLCAWGAVLTLFFLFFLQGFPTARRRWGQILCVAMICYATACIGCGGGTNGGGGTIGSGGGANPGTPTNVTYTVTVTAAGTGGTPSHTASFTFIVQ
ncbi:MAG: Ig-like domain repeat protein [Acidobacteriia bacterium]|nr:Ig-like domain repeat protein [Terriglobia bacterium]